MPTSDGFLKRTKYDSTIILQSTICIPSKKICKNIHQLIHLQYAKCDILSFKVSFKHLTLAIWRDVYWFIKHTSRWGKHIQPTDPSKKKILNVWTARDIDPRNIPCLFLRIQLLIHVKKQLLGLKNSFWTSRGWQVCRRMHVIHAEWMCNLYIINYSKEIWSDSSEYTLVLLPENILHNNNDNNRHLYQCRHIYDKVSTSEAHQDKIERMGKPFVRMSVIVPSM